jgi:hypothetical protein
MARAGCTLSLTVATTDQPFLHLTIPHIVRASRFAFVHRMVFADVSPVSAQFVRRPPGSTDALIRVLEELKAEGEIDEIVLVEDGSALVRDAWKGVFRRPLSHPRDYRGAPIASYLLSLALCPTRFMLHLDGDMLLHQAPDVDSWVEHGMALLDQHEDLGAVAPLPGPPHPHGVLRQRVPFERDPRGFFRFRQFSSRIFLVEPAKIERLHPLDPSWPLLTPPGRRITNLVKRVRGQSALPRWEKMIEDAFRRSGLYRADVPGAAWHLHPHARGEAFVRLLPRIIEDVEVGRFPPAQAGRYNMDFDAWQARYASRGAPVGEAVTG